MKLSEIHKVLELSELHTFFPVEFMSHVEESSTVSIAGGTMARGGVFETRIRIVTRETHPIVAETKAHEIKEYLLDNLKGAFFNGKKVLTVDTETPEPLTIGEEFGLYYVSWNYRILEG